jgi:hypothetical protein
MLETLNIMNWDEPIAEGTQHRTLHFLESGYVIFLPQLPFKVFPQETLYLSDKFASPKAKNISYDVNNGVLQGAICSKEEYIQLSQLMDRYATYTKMLLNNLLPYYNPHLLQGRTSFRPVEIAGRKAASYRKDDTLLHVDAFPATPMRGKRILRVFSNVNPFNQPRVWRLGAPFVKVIEYFQPKLKPPFPGSAWLLNGLKITKEKRTKYDHYMLQLHNAMKADKAYQQQVPQIQFQFPSGSTWIVFTDQVSHAAESGKLTLEQTFYLPPEALANIEKSPCSLLEKFLGCTLLS